jgi:hypothetical protein
MFAFLCSNRITYLPRLEALEKEEERKLQEAQDAITKLSEKLEQASAAKREQGEFDRNFAHDPDSFFFHTRMSRGRGFHVGLRS